MANLYDPLAMPPALVKAHRSHRQRTSRFRSIATTAEQRPQANSKTISTMTMERPRLTIFVLIALSCTLAHPSFSQATRSRVVDDGGTGTHSAIMMADRSLPTHTIFRPEDISEFGDGNKMPIIAWGNGACYDSPWEHVNFLNEVASHGFLVIAIGTMPREEGEQIKESSNASKLLDAIDWAISQNEDENSPYHDKVEVSKIAVSGMSCGGLQALEVADDPRITTLVICNSGIFSDPQDGNPVLPDVTKRQLEKIHSPTLYLLGGPSDIAYENGMDDVDRIDHVPVFVGNMDVGHAGTYARPHGGEFARVATAWYKWQLKDDHDAGTLFTGHPPALSQSPEWTVDKKNIP